VPSCSVRGWARCTRILHKTRFYLLYGNGFHTTYPARQLGPRTSGLRIGRQYPQSFFVLSCCGIVCFPSRLRLVLQLSLLPLLPYSLPTLLYKNYRKRHRRRAGCTRRGRFVKIIVPFFPRVRSSPRPVRIIGVWRSLWILWLLFGKRVEAAGRRLAGSLKYVEFIALFYRLLTLDRSYGGPRDTHSILLVYIDT
jgi:hypothetical protein